MNCTQRSRGPYGLTLNIIEKGTDSTNGSDNQVLVAEIGTEIVFDPSILDTYHYAGWKPVHHDLLVVCAAVEFADRRRARRATSTAVRFPTSCRQATIGVCSASRAPAYVAPRQ